LVAILDGPAISRAAIILDGIAVIADFITRKHPVPALDNGTRAQLARSAKTPRALGLAVGGTTVAILLVAIVTHFANRELYDAVPASRSLLAELARLRTDPAILELAGTAAAIATVRIAVVAILARFNAAIVTFGDERAGLSGRALIPGVLHCAVSAAAVVIEGVAIVANLARANGAVAANDLSCAFALLGTIPVRFDLANAVAAITGNSVSVVTFLDVVLVVDSIAASLRHLGTAAGIICAVAVAYLAPRAGDGGEGKATTRSTMTGSTDRAAMSACTCACAALPSFDGCIRAGKACTCKDCGQTEAQDWACE
jgi:hypothetical protein